MHSTSRRRHVQAIADRTPRWMRYLQPQREHCHGTSTKLDDFVIPRQPDSASCRHDSTSLQDSKMSLAAEAKFAVISNAAYRIYSTGQPPLMDVTYAPWGSTTVPTSCEGTDLTQCDIVYIFPSLSALSNATGSETSIPIFSAIHQRKNSVSPIPLKQRRSATSQSNL